MTALSPIVCSPDAARCIGAKPYLTPPAGLNELQLCLFIAGAAARLDAVGLLPVLTHGQGAILFLTPDPDAHRRQ